MAKQRTATPQLRDIYRNDGPERSDRDQTPTSEPIWAEFLTDDTVVALQFLSTNGLPILSEVRVFPWDGDTEGDRGGTWSGDLSLVPKGGISPGLVKDLALGTLRDQALAVLANPRHPFWRDEDDAEGGIASWFEVTDSIRRHRRSTPNRRGGRNPTPDLQLAKVSFFYQEAAQRGQKIHRFIKGRMPEIDNVGNYIVRARERGFLKGGGGERGRKGGVMSRKAVEVLLEHGVLEELVRRESE